jgi:hypothetical protein
VRSVVEEYLRGGVASQEAASLRDFGDKPLFVVTAGAGNDASWQAAQTKLATLPRAFLRPAIQSVGRSCGHRDQDRPNNMSVLERGRRRSL